MSKKQNKVTCCADTPANRERLATKGVDEVLQQVDLTEAEKTKLEATFRKALGGRGHILVTQEANREMMRRMALTSKQRMLEGLDRDISYLEKELSEMMTEASDRKSASDRCASKVERLKMQLQVATNDRNEVASNSNTKENTMPINHQWYGWRPARPNFQARKFTKAVPPVMSLPTSVDLRPQMPAIYNQEALGSCTANSTAGLVQYLMQLQKKPSYMPSRLFTYYNERVVEGTISTDSGGTNADAMNSLFTLGAPPETEWTYDITQFATQPPAVAYTDGKQHLLSEPLQVGQDELSLRQSLAAGYPVVVGFTVYQSFEDQKVANSGVVSMPEPGEQMLGGHSVLLVGYNPDGWQRWICRNSWGSDWGQAGYFTMPNGYLLDPNYSNDFWTAQGIN